MTEPKARPPTSFWHRRLPGIRYIYSVAGIVSGVLFLILYSVTGGADRSGQSWWLAAGSVLLGVGSASILIYQWMDRRGI